MGYKVDSLQLELTVTAKQTASSLNRVADALKKIKEETKDMSALVKLRKELTSFSKVNLTPIADALNTIASSSSKARDRLSQMLSEIKNTQAFSPVGNTDFLDSRSGSLDDIKGNTGTLTAAQEEYRGVTGSVVELSGAEKESDDAARRCPNLFR